MNSPETIADSIDSSTQPAKTSLVEDFLEHYGTKGMKWGVRKSRSRVTKTGRTQFQKPPHRLSDADLTKRIKRMELEKKYRELNTPDKSAGRTYSQNLLENAGRTAAGAVVGGAVGFFLQRALKQKFGG